jgi:hypothetical protein
MSTPSTVTVRQALILTEKEWSVLFDKIRESSFLRNRGVEVYTEPCEPLIVDNKGTREPAVFVKVRGETPVACGIGIGWVTAQGEYYQQGSYSGVNG